MHAVEEGAVTYGGEGRILRPNLGSGLAATRIAAFATILTVVSGNRILLFPQKWGVKRPDRTLGFLGPYS